MNLRQSASNIPPQTEWDNEDSQADISMEGMSLFSLTDESERVSLQAFL